MGLPEIDFDSLTVDERLRLLERVWESLSQSARDVPLTAEQQAELDRRLDELDGEEEPAEQMRPNKSNLAHLSPSNVLAISCG